MESRAVPIDDRTWPHLHVKSHLTRACNTVARALSHIDTPHIIKQPPKQTMKQPSMGLLIDTNCWRSQSGQVSTDKARRIDSSRVHGLPCLLGFTRSFTIRSASSTSRLFSVNCPRCNALQIRSNSSGVWRYPPKQGPVLWRVGDVSAAAADVECPPSVIKKATTCTIPAAFRRTATARAGFTPAAWSGMSRSSGSSASAICMAPGSAVEPSA